MKGGGLDRFQLGLKASLKIVQGKLLFILKRKYNETILCSFLQLKKNSRRKGEPETLLKIIGGLQ